MGGRKDQALESKVVNAALYSLSDGRRKILKMKG
jgi:hypothetical protein